MENDVIKEVLSELLEESKSNRQEILFLKNALETNAKNMDDIYVYLSNLKFNVPIGLFKSELRKGVAEIKIIVESQPKEILHEKKILMFPDSISGENIFRFLYRKTLLFSLLGFGLFLVSKYGSHVINENSKYKQTYEYIYFNNTKSQAYFQNVLNAFESDSTSKALKDKIKELKQKSRTTSNPKK